MSLEKNLGQVTITVTEVKETLRTEIDSTGAGTPAVRFLRRHVTRKDGAIQEHSTYQVPVNVDLLNPLKAYTFGPKTVTARDVMRFLRALADEIDPLDGGVTIPD
jgi:hypothetical protein